MSLLARISRYSCAVYSRTSSFTKPRTSRDLNGNVTKISLLLILVHQLLPLLLRILPLLLPLLVLFLLSNALAYIEQGETIVSEARARRLSFLSTF